MIIIYILSFALCTYLGCGCDGQGTEESYLNKCTFTGKCTCKKGFTGDKCAGKWYFNLCEILRKNGMWNKAF